MDIFHRLTRQAPRYAAGALLMGALWLPSHAHAAPDADVAKKAAAGDAAALTTLRAMSAEDMVGSLKAVLGNASDKERNFITKELLRIGTDDAMAALAGAGAGDTQPKNAIGELLKGNNGKAKKPRKKKPRRGKLSQKELASQDWDNTLTAIEKALASRAMKSTPEAMKPFVEKAAELKTRLTKEPYAAGESKDPELHVLSVYEADLPEGVNKGLGIRVPGHMSVDITYTERPVTLLLCAYDPVVWNLSLKPGVTIDAIFLSGYHEQDVTGIPDGVTIKRASHEKNSGDDKFVGYLAKSLTAKNAKSIERFTGMPATTFQTTYRGKSMQVGPENTSWRAMHALKDAKALLSEISGKAPAAPTKLDEIISGLDDEDNRHEAIQDLLTMNTKAAKDALLEWAEDSLEDSDDISFMEAFTALSRLDDERVTPFFIRVIEQGTGGQMANGLRDMQIRDAHKGLALKARSGDSAAVAFLLKTVKASLANAKDDSGQAYADLHRLDSVLGDAKAKAEAKALLDTASESDIELIKTTAKRLKTTWGL